MRNIYVLGVSLFLGLSIAQYFAMNTTYDGHGPVRTNAGWVSYVLRLFCSPYCLSQSSQLEANVWNKALKDILKSKITKF